MKNNYDSLEQRLSYMQKEYGAAKPYRLEQHGDLDLSFDGWKVSEVHGEFIEGRPRVDVILYYTTMGSFIGHIARTLPASKDYKNPVTKTKTGAFPSPLELLKWLREDGRGFIGNNSKIAWEEYCTRLPWLQQSATVRA